MLLGHDHIPSVILLNHFYLKPQLMSLIIYLVISVDMCIAPPLPKHLYASLLNLKQMSLKTYTLESFGISSPF